MKDISSNEGNLETALKNNSEQLTQYVRPSLVKSDRFAGFAIDRFLYLIYLCKVIPGADSPK